MPDSPSLAGRSLWASVTRWFFANFFRLLILTISVSQWTALWWVLGPVAWMPFAGHLLGPALIYAANRWFIMRSRQPALTRNNIRRLPRLYYAVAFTCLFCSFFLLLNGVLWTMAKVFVGAIVVHARSADAGLTLHSTFDTAFRWMGNIGFAGIVLAFAYGYSIGQLRLRVRQLQLPLRDITAALHGLRIAQISDIHIGENLDVGQLERFVERVNAERPDLICITGDIADSPSADLDAFLPTLARLRAPHGIYAILGNHDHYAGADRVAAALQRHTPFTLLRDRHVEVEIRGQRVHVIGLDDRGRDWARGVPAVACLATILESLPTTEPKLLLCHRPDIFPQAAAGRIGLTLSGHTHGGQLAIPWFGGRFRNLAEFITKFDRGLYERDGSYLYVNCGLGVTGQRIRLCTPREITLIEVVADAVQGAA